MPLYQSSQDRGRWAYTVRPDLWAAGTRVYGGGFENLARRSWSVDLSRRELARALARGYGDPGVGEALALARGYGDPGVGEALVLAGVWSDQGPAGMTWEEVA